MATQETTVASLAAVFDVMRAHLDERQRRLLLGAGAQVLGRGGIWAVARAAGAAGGHGRVRAAGAEAGGSEPP